MVQDSEKRFHSIMDKLFQPPKSLPSPSSSSGVQVWRGKKGTNSTSALALVDPKTAGNRVERFEHCSAPLCRPWDRGDLMRRVATFKSMTWFAKPKVFVSCSASFNYTASLYFRVQAISLGFLFLALLPLIIPLVSISSSSY